MIGEWFVFHSVINIDNKVKPGHSTCRHLHHAVMDGENTITWWRHQMETFSALLAICAGNSPVSGEFPAQRPVSRSFDVFFDLCPNKRLSKQSGGWWFQMQSSSLWRHFNEHEMFALDWWSGSWTMHTRNGYKYRDRVSRHRDSNYNGERVMRQSYLCKGIYHSAKTSSLSLKRPLGTISRNIFNRN